MVTEKTASHDGENREKRPEHSPRSEQTVTVDFQSSAELRCGITLRDEAETEETRQPSAVDEDDE